MTSNYTSRKNRFSLDINDHEEKPSQRVPSPYILILLGFYMLMAYFAQSMEHRMPSVIQEREIPSSESNIFSEEKANQYLHEIIGDQPRVSGTEYHLAKTKDLKALLENITSNANIPVKIDWQYASGDYWLEFSSPHVNCYQNLSNIISVLEGESGFRTDGSTGTSILVNCHYDSVPFAIGASDNGVFCGAMAETLSKLSRRKKKFKHNIIFLFNGSEETPLQASHAFLSHPWAKGVVNVVNLDSAGMNGLPNVFQVTDPRLLRSYQRSCPRPSAQSLGEALFASGVIPSDTDFRIFRDFGNIQGVDIAFVKGGNVYHTRNDKPSLILEGVMQNTGNTLLNFIKDLADQEELAEKVESPVSMVYYDYLTLFMLSYSLTAAHVADALAAACGAASVLYYLWIVGMRRSSVEELLLSVLGRLLCALSGLAALLLVIVVTAYTTTQMRYLSRPWLVVPLYWLPCAVTAVAVSHLYDSYRTRKHGLTAVLRAAQAMAASRLLLTALLAVLLLLPALAPVRYLLAVPLVLTSAGAFISLTVLMRRPAAWLQLVVDVAVSLPAVLLLLSLALRMSALLLPIAGRSGSSCPDCTTGVVSGALALLVLSVPSGIELVFSRRRLWAVLGAVGVACAVVMFLPLSPYQDDGTATQRHYWFHTKITSFDADMKEMNSTSGVLVTKLDAYSVESAAAAISAAQPTLAMRRLATEDCEKTVYCDMPLYRPRFDRYLTDSLFVYSEPPQEFPHELRLRNRTCDRHSCTLDFVMNGPAHNTIIICPREGVNLTAWSFAARPDATREHRGRPVYVVIHAIGTHSDPLPSLEFQLTFEVDSPSSLLADVSHHAHKIHHPEDYTPFYKRLLLAMPKYFNVASFLTFKNNYVF